jgi:hypothetical protein
MKHVDRYFFEPISTLPMAFYRIVFGVTVLADGLLMVEFLPEFFGSHGVLSEQSAARLAPGIRVNLVPLLPSGDVWLFLFFAAYLLAAVCLTIGLSTRTAATAVWLGLVSLHHRNPLILNSGDTFLRIAAFWLIFSPAGRALSIDSWRAGAAVPTAEPWAQRMIQIQVSTLYATTVWLKLSGADWIDGTAVYWVTRLPEFARFPVPYIFDHMWTIRALTWGTLVVELALASLVWVRRFRPWVLLAGVLFHLAIEWSMVLAMMQWVLIGAYAVFLEKEQVLRLLPCHAVTQERSVVHVPRPIRVWSAPTEARPGGKGAAHRA